MAHEKDDGASHENEGGTTPENAGGRTYYVNIPIRPMTGNMDDEDLDRISIYYAIYGFVFGGLGAIAIVVPILIGTSILKLLSWILVLSGAVSIMTFLLICGAPGTISFILFGILNMGAGLWILLEPSFAPAWSTSLTFIIMVWFVVHGLIKFLMCNALGRLTTWILVLLSGIASLALSVVVLVLAEKMGNTIIIISFGADLCFTGVAFVLTAFMAFLGKGKRSITDAEAIGEPLLGSGSAAASA